MSTQPERPLPLNGSLPLERSIFLAIGVSKLSAVAIWIYNKL